MTANPVIDISMDDGFDLETDLLVAGAGAGGMAAALFARLEGLAVIVAEKTGEAGGTAATSAGTLWIPGNTQSREAGYADNPADAARYMDGLIGNGGNCSVRQAYLDSGPGAINRLMAETDVQFLACGRHPDYLDRPGAAVSGRAIIPVPFDGRQLHGQFARIRAPMREFMVFGGMMVGKSDIPRLLNRFGSVRDFAFSAGLFLRYLTDRLRHRRGTRIVMGNALVARLYQSLLKAGADIRFEAPVTALLRLDGAIAGAEIMQAGQRLRVRARRGVVLATGGVGHNRAYREAFMPSPAPEVSLAAPGVTGDGLSLGEAAGARIDPSGHGTGGFWTPVSRVHHPDGTIGHFPHLSLDRAKPGLIAVNVEGRRFVNEADSYHDFVLAMLGQGEGTGSVPSWLVCSAAFVARYGLGAIHPGTHDLSAHEKRGDLVRDATVAGLARKAGIDPDGLVQTLARHDAAAARGEDPEFGKGSSELNRFNGDPAHGPNPCVGPVGPGPYVAMQVWPAEIACSTGLPANADGQVLDASGKPVDGLYACGNDMGSIMAGTYPGPGTTLGPAVVFAARIAAHAAARSV